MSLKDHEPITPNYKKPSGTELEVRRVPKLYDDGKGIQEFHEEIEQLAEWCGGTVIGTSHHESMWGVLLEDRKGTSHAIVQGWWVAISTDGRFIKEPTLDDIIEDEDLMEIKPETDDADDILEVSIQDLAELLVLLQVPASMGRLGAAVDPLARIRKSLGLFGYPGTEEVVTALRNTELR